MHSHECTKMSDKKNAVEKCNATRNAEHFKNVEKPDDGAFQPEQQHDLAYILVFNNNSGKRDEIGNDEKVYAQLAVNGVSTLLHSE